MKCFLFLKLRLFFNGSSLTLPGLLSHSWKLWFCRKVFGLGVKEVELQS